MCDLHEATAVSTQFKWNPLNTIYNKLIRRTHEKPLRLTQHVSAIFNLPRPDLQTRAAFVLIFYCMLGLPYNRSPSSESLDHFQS